MKKVHYQDGVRETWEFQGDDLYIKTEEDVSSLIAQNKQRQANTSSWRKFNPNQEFHQVIDMSMTDVMRIYEEHGVDVTSPPYDWKYIYRLIETHYPYMKTTTARLV